MRVIGLFVTLALLAPLAPSAQQAPQAPTFRLEVSYVEVDAVVTDADGKFVRGLTKDDFEILEDGRSQQISAFSAVDLPARSAAVASSRGAPVEPDVRSNEGDFNGRVIVLLLDDLLVDAKRTLRTRTVAKQFIEGFVADNDLVAVLNTSGASTSAQNFTSNRALMLAAVDRFTGQRLQSVAMATMEEYKRSGKAVDPHALERASRSRTALGRLSGAADFLGGIRGRRKTLVWFTEGVDYDLDNKIDADATIVRESMSNLIGTAQRAGVTFYAVDPRGLGAGLDDNIDMVLPEDFSVNIGMRQVLDEVRWTQSTMHAISTETGGFAIVGGGDINQHFARIIDENSSYYLLGYYPTPDKKDGKFRALEVRVKRPGLRVRSRKGYTAPRTASPARSSSTTAAAPPELRAAIDSPIPVAGVPLRVFAAPFRGPAKNAAVAIIIEVNPAGFRFEQRDGAFIENLEVLIVPVNAAGKALDGARDEAPLKLSARSHELVRTHGLRLARRLDLPPGRYQLHVAAQSGTSKAVGALTYDLDVPDFSKLPLGMSGIALMSVAADRIPTPAPDKSFMDVLPMAATALRDFDRSDSLIALVDVYPSASGTPHAVQIHTAVTADDGRVVFRSTDERRTDESNVKGGALRHTAKFPLTSLLPGRYVLRVEAKALTSGGAAAARQLEFRVR